MAAYLRVVVMASTIQWLTALHATSANATEANKRKGGDLAIIIPGHIPSFSSGVNDAYITVAAPQNNDLKPRAHLHL
ncbi:hypothetical protein BDP55DRAFT_724129 [Colletotrichum godetiae]|uniref:Uncharacterized protein n=1 Tax=Colletotrichum godetiae TaxID=1209918 RepID=A0AAJ0B0M3_9PEZI|nr:uncharacterized protein BDP55DRAFT_724129 [Colletotrichum godetiae]KAK1691564.1 hypothetical protein BDP55DRAFT_724129 [Colletotrichum godetiae]